MSYSEVSTALGAVVRAAGGGGGGGRGGKRLGSPSVYGTAGRDGRVSIAWE